MCTEDKLQIHTIQKLHTTQKATNTKHSKTKLPWFSYISWHSARKLGGLILQCSQTQTGLVGIVVHTEDIMYYNISTTYQPTGRFWMDNAAATTHCKYHRVNNECTTVSVLIFVLTSGNYCWLCHNAQVLHVCCKPSLLMELCRSCDRLRSRQRTESHGERCL